MIRPFIVVVAVSLTSLAAGSGAQSAQGMAKRGGNPEAAKNQNPVPSTPESVGQGRRVYQRLCSRCHGSAGQGGARGGGGAQPADLTDDRWDYGSSDGEIFAAIHDGTSI